MAKLKDIFPKWLFKERGFGDLVALAHLAEDADNLAVTSDWSIYAEAAETYAGFGPDGTFYSQPASGDDWFAAVYALGTGVPSFRIHGDGTHIWSDGTADPGNGSLLAPVRRGATPAQQDGLAFADFFEGREVDAVPDAPPANKGRIYFKDVGGKTALMVRFPTGIPQQVAIQP